MSVASHRTRRSIRIAASALALSGFALVGTATGAGATMGCGEYSFGFEGTRLLNDGISNTAGPFAIELPEGTYDILMQSHDAHDEHPGQVEQTHEQWYFTLDSGYTSPASTDVADDHNMSVDEFDGVAIAATTSITLHHLGEGGVNSVDPVCVGFTTSEVAEPVIAAPVDDTEIEIAGPVSPPEEPEEAAVVEEPTVEVVVPEKVAVEVKQVVEVAAPPAVVEAPTEVKGQVVEAPAQLAVTGTTQQAALGLVLITMALGMLFLGLSRAERRTLG